MSAKIAKHHISNTLFFRWPPSGRHPALERATRNNPGFFPPLTWKWSTDGRPTHGPWWRGTSTSNTKSCLWPPILLIATRLYGVAAITKTSVENVDTSGGHARWRSALQLFLFIIFLFFFFSFFLLSKYQELNAMYLSWKLSTITTILLESNN